MVIQTTLVRLSFNEAAAQYIVNNKIINSIKSLSRLDDDMINHMCKSCRKACCLEHEDGDDKGQIAHSHTIGVIQENALKNVVFYINYQLMTSRVPSLRDILLESLEPISDFKKLMSKMDNPSADEVPKLSAKRVFEFFDKFKDFLNENIGSVSNWPLGYVV